jgi:hypothetical protein
MAVCFGLVYLHVISAQRQFQLDDLTTQEQKAQSTYQGLRATTERLNSPGRVMRVALGLGMQEPAYITSIPAVAGGTITPLGVPAPRTGATAPGGIVDWSGTKADVAGAP